MRIAHCIRALVAVLGLAAVIQPVASNRHSNVTNESHSPRSSKRSKMDKTESFIHEECCPTTEEMIIPKAGRNRDGIFVELYRDDNYKQMFYEKSCKPEVLNKSCKFVNKKVTSVCVQDYIYSYALVSIKNHPGPYNALPGQQNYFLDFIRIKSGCSCHVTKQRKKKRRPFHNHNVT